MEKLCAENERGVHMMKKMSRFLSVLLVLAMLCAMVPAVFAADNRVVEPGEKINELWKNDTFELPMPSGCTGKRVTTLTKKDGTSLNTNYRSYISYNSSTGKYTASYSTVVTDNSIPDGYILAKVTCDKSNCTAHASAPTYKLKIYDPVSTFSAKTSNVIVTKGKTATVDLTISPATIKNTAAAKDDIGGIYCVPDETGVAEAKYDPAKNQVTISYKKDGKVDLELIADYNTSHAKSIWITVSTTENAVVSMKKGSTVIATSIEAGEDTATVGEKMTLTATVDGATGTTNNVTWTSSDSSKVYVSNKGAVEVRAVGRATITATSVDTGAKAEYTLNVIDKITGITLKEGTDAITSKEVAANTNFTITAETNPKGSEGSVTWTVDDKYVLDISKNDGYNETTGKYTGSAISVTPLKAGTATLTASVGGKSKSMTIRVTEEARTATVSEVMPQDGKYTVRIGTTSAIREALQQACPKVPAYVTIGKDKNKVWVDIPVQWGKVSVATDKKTATVTGLLEDYDADSNLNFKYDTGEDAVTLKVNLTDDAAVTKNEIKFTGKDTAVAKDKVAMSCTATREPAEASLSYQWYRDGVRISGATSASYTYTVPTDTEDSNETYEFYCIATASRNGKENTLKSNVLTLKVSREYSVAVDADVSSATYTVGQSPKMTATVRYKGNAVNANVSWKLLDANGKDLSSNIAAISTAGVITTKATGDGEGQKITVQAQYSYGGYTYTGTKTITLNPASVGKITLAAGGGAYLKSTTIQSKIKSALASGITASYVKFGSQSSCTLTKGSSSSASKITTSDKCYFSTTSGTKLSDVYVTLSSKATSGSVKYTAYDSNDNAVAAGTISFDDESADGSITPTGIAFDDADVIDMINEEFAGESTAVDYVKFDKVDSKKARLLDGYKTIATVDSAKDVTSDTKYYLKGSSDNVEDLYLLPRTDYYGTIEIDYTAYSSSNKALGDGTLTFTVTRRTSSAKFSDVTSSNVGSWAADAIDFMEANNLVGGTGANKFSPNGTMTRCDLVLILYRMAGQPSVAGVENPFNDVKTGDYFYNAVMWAYKNGVVGGTGGGKFSPKSNVSREQIAAILYRYSGATTATGSLNAFTDAKTVSTYAETAMKWAVGAGIIGGSNNKLTPKASATRAQVAVMLHRFLNK